MEDGVRRLNEDINQNFSQISVRIDELEIPDISYVIKTRAAQRLDDLTKPIGSLGKFETLLVRLAGMQGRIIPEICLPHALIFAADHGVAKEEVSAYGSEVTEEMVVNMCMGTAVSSVLARHHQMPIRVIDMGIRRSVRHPNVLVQKVALGTKNFIYGPAMSIKQAEICLHTGAQSAKEVIDNGCDLLILGEMGIANTTVASAMLAVLCGVDVDAVVGIGTGIGDEKFSHKKAVIRQSIAINQPDPQNPWEVLAKLGGFEIGAMAGAVLYSASRQIPVLLDGVITTAAAILACRIHPKVKEYLIAGHLSPEPAHRIALAELGLEPLLDAGLRLGEGSGALLAYPLLQQACAVMAQTATFTDARVSNPHRTSMKMQQMENEEAKATPHLNELGTQPAPVDFSLEERAAVYKAILARRDIRIFLPDPIPDEVLRRILTAAHHAPSVGYMQPWNFLLIRDKQRLATIQQAVERERIRAGDAYEEAKKEYYLRLKVEGLTEAPLTICVTNDTSRGGPHVLGRNTIPETDLMSTSCAIENMWLAARAEGVALGWVSIYQKQDIREILQIPNEVDPVALLTLGYTPYFPEIPVLERVGWGKRLRLETLIYENEWGHPAKI